jgi:hypothetical protein
VFDVVQQATSGLLADLDHWQSAWTIAFMLEAVDAAIETNNEGGRLSSISHAGVIFIGSGWLAPLAVLLVEIRHSRRRALIAQGPEPVGMSRSRRAPALAAGNDPVDARSRVIGMDRLELMIAIERAIPAGAIRGTNS